jgi:hypothetical protein
MLPDRTVGPIALSGGQARIDTGSDMSEPSFISDLLASVMLAVALCGTARFLAASREDKKRHGDIDAAHGLMGLGMAAMLVPSCNVLSDYLWGALFALVAVWFSWSSLRTALRALPRADRGGAAVSHLLSHAVMAFGMVFMYLAPTMRLASSGTMVMANGQGAPSDTLWLSPLFLIIIAGTAVFELDSTYRLAHLPLGRESLGLVSSAALANSRAGGVVSRDEAPRPAPSSGDVRRRARRLEVACHVAMCLTMGYMLIFMR